MARVTMRQKVHNMEMCRVYADETQIRIEPGYSACYVGNFINRFADYEDLGEPEEIKEKLQRLEKLEEDMKKGMSA